MRRSSNVATPATAFRVVVPSRAAPGTPVPAAIAKVTAALEPAAVLPNESSTATWTGGTIAVPAAVVTGATTKTRESAGPASAVADAVTSESAKSAATRPPIV